eukprot:TRINITY_DN70064_c0_g1_i1.p1 TRINITY_DN70064_c0_g1~~TRINITY_DN70064_c0_g1_i1.p1  ORF type:complete len:504 (+),score=120.45 TRINITY_DN70064_c0_g1_i1:96-1607(+)
MGDDVAPPAKRSRPNELMSTIITRLQKQFPGLEHKIIVKTFVSTKRDEEATIRILRGNQGGGASPQIATVAVPGAQPSAAAPAGAAAPRPPPGPPPRHPPPPPPPEHAAVATGAAPAAGPAAAGGGGAAVRPAIGQIFLNDEERASAQAFHKIHGKYPPEIRDRMLRMGVDKTIAEGGIGREGQGDWDRIKREFVQSRKSGDGPIPFEEEQKLVRQWLREVQPDRERLFPPAPDIDPGAVTERGGQLIPRVAGEPPGVNGLDGDCEDHRGEVRSVHADTGHGTITCEAVKDRFGAEVYFYPKLLVMPGCTRGRKVRFRLMVQKAPKGLRYYARDVRPDTGEPMAPPPAPRGAAADASKRRAPVLPWDPTPPPPPPAAPPPRAPRAGATPETPLAAAAAPAPTDKTLGVATSDGQAFGDAFVARALGGAAAAADAERERSLGSNDADAGGQTDQYLGDLGGQSPAFNPGFSPRYTGLPVNQMGAPSPAAYQQRGGSGSRSRPRP